jgi:phosphate uptake regulator
MELRKVQLTGGSSLTVTLPKTWAEKADLQAGDVVGCAEQPDGSMAVHPHAKGDREIRTYHLSADGADTESLFRQVISAYLNGFDAITVTSVDEISPEARDAVQRAKDRIMGLEIIEEDMGSVTVQDFLDPKDFHVDKALRRLQMLTQAMQQDADDLLTTPNDRKRTSVRDRDDEVDRLFWLINKQFHALLRDVSYASKMELSPGEAHNFLLVARLCERTADHANRVAGEAMEIPRDGEADEFLGVIARAWRRSTSLFEDAVDTFRHHDPETADRVIQEANEFQEEQAQLLKRGTDFGSQAAVHIAFVVESIGRTAAYAANIAEIAINHDVAAPEGGI